MYNDTISDFITRLRNAVMASKDVATVRYSKSVDEIARVLKNEGFISSIEKDGLHLKITIGEASPLSHIKRLSKPSLRRYVAYSRIPRPRTGFGTILLTTPKGIMTGNQARKQKVGGELICEVW